MKSTFTIPALLMMLSVTLCACPYSSAYQLDDEPSIYVEDALLGKWTTEIKKSGSTEVAPVNLTLSRRNETEYNVRITGYLDPLRPYHILSADSISGTAFMSTIDGNQFLNIHIKAQVYVAELKFDNNKLSILPLVEHFTSKMVLNNLTLRNCVQFHYKTRSTPMYDEDFCLKDMTKVY